MISKSRVTIEQVRTSFNTSVPNNLTVTYFARPMANILTPFFYNLGWSANRVTLLRTFAALAGILALMFLEKGIYVGCFLVYLCFILDCVDGNLARLNDSATYFGKFIDGLADMLYAYGFPFAVGFGVWRTTDEDIFLLVGLVITLASLANQLVRSRLSFVREWMINTSGPLSESTKKSADTIASYQSNLSAVSVNSRFFATGLLLIPEIGPFLYLLGLVIFQGLLDFVLMFLTLFQAKLILSRGRRSIHTSPHFFSQR